MGLPWSPSTPRRRQSNNRFPRSWCHGGWQWRAWVCLCHIQIRHFEEPPSPSFLPSPVRSLFTGFARRASLLPSLIRYPFSNIRTKNRARPTSVTQLGGGRNGRGMADRSILRSFPIIQSDKASLAPPSVRAFILVRACGRLWHLLQLRLSRRGRR